MAHYDSIIIGGGHNGLVCAAYLAKAGHTVLLVEAGDGLGGLAASHEFHPGFHTSVAHSLTHLSTKVAEELNLSAHGCVLGPSLKTIGLGKEGSHVTVSGETVSGASEQDAKAYADYRRLMTRFADVMEPAWHKTMPPFGNNNLSELTTFGQIGLHLRRLGSEDMGEFLRVASLPARDLMTENFESEILQAVMSWDGLIGSKMAPRSPNNTVFSLLMRMTGQYGGDHALPQGGIGALISALEAAASASGVEMRTKAPVARVLIEPTEKGLVATGVELEGGEKITASHVISAIDPQRTFLGLVDARNLEIQFTNRIRRLRCQGYVAKLHLALSGLPKFTGIERPDGRMIIAPNLDAIEFAFDDAKYGEASQHPVMEIILPSLHSEGLAPNGNHVLSAHVMYVPYEHKGGWRENTRHALYERVIKSLEQYAPNIRELILHQELLTPYDLEQNYNVTGGHWHHTEFALDQKLMMRPTYEAAQYKTPIPGLYLASAGCHPGGGLMGTAGHNAANEILK